MADEFKFAQHRAAEERLRAALDEAKMIYDLAKHHYRLAQEGVGNLDHPDNGAFTLTRAAKMHQEALEAYKQALFNFNCFVIRRSPLAYP